MTSKIWSGQQDLNLRQPLENTHGDSDRRGQGAGKTRLKPGYDSDIPPGVTRDAFDELLIESGHARRRAAAQPAPILNAAIADAMIESIGHPDTISVGEDPLLAKLQRGKR